MATYKVIQDIEADDKLIGWMSPRQAIYAAIVIVSGFLCFLFATNGAWWLSIPMLPHMILLTVLSGPFVHDQPSEVWLLAKIQFFLKPRRRIWNQSGILELVTITVPKKIEQQLTDGLSQTEVKSRLQALANTIDSRGWAVKNVNVNLFAQPAYADVSTDRLIDTTSLPQEVPAYDIAPHEDILDEQSNPTAQHMQQMINQSSQTHRQQIMQQMQHPTSQQPQAQWFTENSTIPQPQLPAVQNINSPMPVSQANGPTADDQQQLIDKLHAQKAQNKARSGRSHVVEPLSNKPPKPVVTPKPPVNPEVLQLANNDDLNIATIARQANKSVQSQQTGDNEVVISLR